MASAVKKLGNNFTSSYSQNLEFMEMFWFGNEKKHSTNIRAAFKPDCVIRDNYRTHLFQEISIIMRECRFIASKQFQMISLQLLLIQE